MSIELSSGFGNTRDKNQACSSFCCPPAGYRNTEGIACLSVATLTRRLRTADTLLLILRSCARALTGMMTQSNAKDSVLESVQLLELLVDCIGRRDLS